MKRLVLGVFLLGCLLSCQKKQPELENMATVLRPAYSMCALCGGWFVQVGTDLYRAAISGDYEVVGKPVYLRFQLQKGASGAAGHWIDIQSIRAR